MWIFYALISALLAATRRTSEKQLTFHFNHFTISFMVQLLSLPLLATALLVHGYLVNPFSLGLAFWLPLIGISIGFYPLNAYWYLQSIKHDEISNVLPIQSLGPVLAMLPAWLTLGETPSPLASIGIASTVAGVYALGLKGKALHHPLAPFRNSKSSRYMLLTVLLFTVTSVFDKVAIQASDAIYYSFASTVGAVIVLFTVLWVTHVHELRRAFRAVPKLGSIGSLQGGSYLMYLLAIGSGPVAYATSVRSSNILLGAFLGIVILKERLTKAKIISSLLIALGIGLLAIGS